MNTMENCNTNKAPVYSSDNKVSLKDIRDTFYQLRNFEISNLWQRSIFLSALLVLFFTAYGYLASEIIKPKKEILLLNEICCGIALCGFVFSIIWIMMAKGSKAWYEVYERRITDIEKEASMGIPEDYRMGADCTPWELDSNLFSKTAGAYSVSKINIMIGNFLMIIWFIILTIHYVAAIIIFQNDNCNKVVHTIIFTLIPVFFLIILITAICNMWAKSGALTKPLIIVPYHNIGHKDD